MNSPYDYRSHSLAGFTLTRTLWLTAVLCLLLSGLADAQPGQPEGVPFSRSTDNPVPNPLTGSPRQAERNLARSMMDNPRNPLLEIVTSEGDLYLELFQEAAPRNTELVLELAQEPAYYYDGLGFTATGNDLFIELSDLSISEFSAEGSLATTRAGPPEGPGAAERPLGATASAPDEINGRGLGLEQQPLLDAAGRPHPWLNVADRADFQRKVLIPLYRSMGIADRAQLESQQDAVMDRLQRMNLMQVYETMGYRYSAQLASRRPVSNSVLMSNHGPGTNHGGLVITLADTPWLTGTHTVVGRLVSGQAIARLISRQPPDSIRIQQLRYVEESP